MAKLSRYSDFSDKPLVDTVGGINIHVDTDGKFYAKLPKEGWIGDRNLAALKRQLAAFSTLVPAVEMSYEEGAWYYPRNIVRVHDNTAYTDQGGKIHIHSLYMPDAALEAELDALDEERKEFDKNWKARVVAVNKRRVRFTEDYFKTEQARLRAEKENKDGNTTG